MPDMFFLADLNYALALGGVLLTIVTIGLFIDIFFYKGEHFGEYVNQYFWYAVMAVTIGSVALSLLYSEYFGFIPCSLCWLQRIAVYPQALLSVMAFFKKDTFHFPYYGIGLSAFGLLVAIYQYIYQMIPAESRSTGIMPCLADGSNADCAAKIINEFGFVTFPYLSGITFAFLIALYLYTLRANRQSAVV